MQLIKFAEAQLVLLFLDSHYVATPIKHLTANSTTVSMVCTSVHDLLKTAVRRKIQLEETDKLFITSTSDRSSE